MVLSPVVVARHTYIWARTDYEWVDTREGKCADHFYEVSTSQVLCLVSVKQQLFACSFVKAHRQPLLARWSLLGELANYHCCLLLVRLLHLLLLKLSLLGEVLRWALQLIHFSFSHCILCAADWIRTVHLSNYSESFTRCWCEVSWIDSVQAKQTTCMLSLGVSSSEEPLAWL